MWILSHNPYTFFKLNVYTTCALVLKSIHYKVNCKKSITVILWAQLISVILAQAASNLRHRSNSGQRILSECKTSCTIHFTINTSVLWVGRVKLAVTLWTEIASLFNNMRWTGTTCSCFVLQPCFIGFVLVELYTLD